MEKRLMKKKKAELVKMLLSKESDLAMLRDHNANLLGMLDGYREALDVSYKKVRRLRDGISVWRTTWVITVFVALMIMLVCCSMQING